MLEIIHADPANAPLIPHEAAGFDDGEGHSQARGQADHGRGVGCYIGLEQSDLHVEAGFSLGGFRGNMPLSVADLARWASLF